MKAGHAATVAVVMSAMMLAMLPAMAADHAVILQYHHVDDDTPASTTTRPDLFAAHLAHLADHDFHVVPLGPVLQALTVGNALPDSTVCLTFDDAWRDVATRAWPLVRERGWTLTLFVATGAVDAGEADVLTWDEMRALADEGMTFAPHSVHHDHQGRPGLDDLQEAEPAPADTLDVRRQRLAADVATSWARLQAELPEAAVLPVYAYPYGEFDPVLQDVIREVGLVGLGQHSGPAWSGHDLTALPRFPMGGPYGSMNDFGLKVASLPLPVLAAEPASMLAATDQPRPALRLEIGPGDYDTGLIAAFVGGEAVTPVWEDQAAGWLRVATPVDLPVGRSRTNVTAPAVTGGRWYWYSHPWLRLP
jgi:peptidoglycan/xylan/chitin deacetylase (PgdA/CDA1 family)